MHDQRRATVERARRLLRHQVRPAVYAQRLALEVTAHHVHGEPITFDEARVRAFVPYAVGDAWGGRWDTTWFRLRATIPGSLAA